MSEPDSLLAAVDQLADRLRAMPQGKLLGPVPGYPTRAAAALDLARRFAATTLEREGLPPHEFPDLGEFAVGDQLAVAGHDLATALTGDAEALAAALAELRRVGELIA